MAYSDTANIILHMPIPGTQEPAAIALLNENCVQIDAHDHTAATGKGLAVGRLRSGLSAAQPGAGNAGSVYFATDTGLFYLDNGTAWVLFHTDPGGGSPDVTLIDPIVRDTLSFGPEGSGLIDSTIRRTDARQLTTNSTLTVDPSPGTLSLIWGAGAGMLSHSGITPVISSLAGANIWLDPNGGAVHPPADGFHTIGHPTFRFAAFHSVAGVINPSTVDAKEDIAPLDPVACAQAVLDTDWVSFSYRGPEGASAKALADTAPARNQKGYVLGSAEHTTSDLFGLEDRVSASPGSDLAVVACALQHALTRLAALESSGA